MELKTKIIATTCVVAAGVACGVTYLFIKDHKLSEKEQTPVVEEEKPTIDNDKKPNVIPSEEEENPPVEEENTDIVVSETEKKPVSSDKKPTSSNSNSQKPVKPVKPIQPGEEEKPSKPEQPILPVEPEQPEVPKEEMDTDLVITSSMITDGIYEVTNQEYNTITIASDLGENTKIILDHVKIKEGLTVVKPGKYQLDILHSSVPNLLVTNGASTFSFKARALENRNKSLEGATINLEGSQVHSISVHSNVEINGDTTVPVIAVHPTDAVVLNIPSEKLSLNTSGVVSVNKSVASITSVGEKTEMHINAPVTDFTNTKTSTIRIGRGNTVTNFHNQGENTLVAGNGTITNAKISANNTRIYTEVTQVTEVAEDIDYLVRKESQIRIVEAKSKSQGSVTFTLSEPVKLSLKDISVICSAGKNISLFHLTTKDDTTYTLTTSYYKNSSYGLYITLPNGNIISEDFNTDYANPTVTDVVTERISATEANLKLYGVDEGGTIYYLLEEATTRSTMSAADIKKNGKSSPVKVGFNSIAIQELEPGKSYHLYYVIEGYFSNLSSVSGPFTIESKIKEVEESKYEIVYAKEEISNRFVFQLNRVPEKELTLQDFEIHCPSDSSLTTKGASFYVSPDLLTYIIVIPNNYGHKDNEYIVKVQVSDNEKIEKSFVTHMNPPVITGAVDGVIRDSKTTAQFTFNSDEAGTVYYGVYEWNGGIYDYNTTTPFASDVITGKIESKQQALHAGKNTITLDLSNIEVTRNTRIWALFMDEVGNYRVGFVDHYKIPEYVESVDPTPDTTLEITNFTYTNNTISIQFNEELSYGITADDIVLSVAGTGTLPSKLLYVINNDVPKEVSITIQNYTLPTGTYQLTLHATDKNGNVVSFEKTMEIS